MTSNVLVQQTGGSVLILSGSVLILKNNKRSVISAETIDKAAVPTIATKQQITPSILIAGVESRDS